MKRIKNNNEELKQDKIKLHIYRYINTLALTNEAQKLFRLQLDSNLIICEGE